MDSIAAGTPDDHWTPVRTLARVPRRVLGALLEKAFTTPDAYPLTLKALTSACSQKSNRDPVVDFTEDQVLEGLEVLQQAGLVAEVHTDGGRTARYRHLVRKRYPWSEPQLAVMTELWLRGRQQVGELRARASRMAPIDSLEQLRSELQPLLAEGYIQASGPLERRGVEADHGFYPPDEAARRASAWSPAAGAGAADEPPPPRFAPAPLAPPAGETLKLQQLCQDLAAQLADLEARLERLEQRVDSLLG